jgi:hypothetical protein
MVRGDATPAADAGFAGVGRYGSDRMTIAAKSSWLGASRAGLRGGVERTGIEPVTSGLQSPLRACGAVRL